MIISRAFLCALVAGTLPLIAPASDSDGGISLAEKMWDEAVANQAARASAAYEAYLKLLPDASEQVVKALEADLADLNDMRKFPNLDVKERAEAASALQEWINSAKEGNAVSEAIAERSSEPFSNKIKTMLVTSSWKWGIPNQGVSAPVVFHEDGSVTNPWNEPWKYEVKARKLILRLYGSSALNTEVVFAVRGSIDKLVDLRRENTLTKD